MDYLKTKFFVVFLIVFLYPSFNLFSQYVEKTGSKTFYYGGTDARIDELNEHNVYCAGFSNSLVQYDEFYLPILPALFFEYKYLILKRNNYFNLSANAKPHVAITTFFLVRLPASVNINLFNEATTELKQGFGLSFGTGYEALITTFNFNEYSPFVQLGFKIDNVSFEYQYKLAKDIYINHSISVGVQLDL